MMALYGFTWQAIWSAVVSFPLALVVACAPGFLVVGRPTKALAGRIMRPTWPDWAKIATVSSSMVIVTVLLMSGFGAIMQQGFTSDVRATWATNIPFNFIAALPLQLIIAGPIVRFVSGRIMVRRRARQAPIVSTTT